MVQVLERLNADYGTRVRLRLTPWKEAVVLFDPLDYQKVQQAAGPCPFGATDALWMLHEVLDKRSGASMRYGRGSESWMPIRRHMQHNLLEPRAAELYANSVTRVARAHVEGLSEVKTTMQLYLQRASFAMISSALLGDIGNTQLDPLLKATVRAMECASGMLMGPLQKLHFSFKTRLWRDWESNVLHMLRETEALVDSAIGNGHDCYVSHLMNEGKLSREEIVTHIPGLLSF